MEDVLAVYVRPYDPRFPQVCMDETSKQLLGDTHEPLPMEPGYPERQDYEYERHGVCNVFLACEPRAWQALYPSHHSADQGRLGALHPARGRCPLSSSGEDCIGTR